MNIVHREILKWVIVICFLCLGFFLIWGPGFVGRIGRVLNEAARDFGLVRPESPHPKQPSTQWRGP